MNNVVYFISPFVRTIYWMPELEFGARPVRYCSKISEINIGLFVFLLRGICGCHLDLVFTASSNVTPSRGNWTSRKGVAFVIYGRRYYGNL